MNKIIILIVFVGVVYSNWHGYGGFQGHDRSSWHADMNSHLSMRSIWSAGSTGSAGSSGHGHGDYYFNSIGRKVGDKMRERVKVSGKARR